MVGGARFHLTTTSDSVHQDGDTTSTTTLCKTPLGNVTVRNGYGSVYLRQTLRPQRCSVFYGHDHVRPATLRWGSHCSTQRCHDCSEIETALVSKNKQEGYALDCFYIICCKRNCFFIAVQHSIFDTRQLERSTVCPQFGRNCSPSNEHWTADCDDDSGHTHSIEDRSTCFFGRRSCSDVTSTQRIWQETISMISEDPAKLTTTFKVHPRAEAQATMHMFCS